MAAAFKAMRIKIRKRPEPPRRRPGQRAHLDRAQILDVAFAVMGEDTTALTVVELAKRLGVYPRAIMIHYPLGLAQITTDLIGLLLTRSAPPVRHGETGGEYIERMFATARRTFHGCSRLAKHVGVELSEDPFVCPALAERLLGALRSMRLKDRALPRALWLTYSALAGFLVMEFPPNIHGARRDWRDREQRRLALLDAGEFPNLTAGRAAVIEYEIARRTASQDVAIAGTARDCARRLIAAIERDDRGR